MTPPLAAEDFKKVMAHPKVLQRHNILSVVFIPAENRMLLSCGCNAAASRTFTEFKLFE